MSLLTTATPYEESSNNHGNNNNKKRIPQIRKTVKKYDSLAEPFATNSQTMTTVESYTPSKDAVTYSSPTPEDAAKQMEDRNARVYELINHITAVNGKDSGAKLADFRPPPNPMQTQEKKLADSAGMVGEITGFTPPALGQSSQLPDHANEFQQPVPKYVVPDSQSTFSPYTSPYTEDAGIRYYEGYAGMGMKNNRQGFGTNFAASSDTKITEKLNYMIRLLEELKVEKTENIMEEFVLFSMLGVFVIFVLDSFTKSAKYVR
jgi:hypothetical protein